MARMITPGDALCTDCVRDPDDCPLHTPLRTRRDDERLPYSSRIAVAWRRRRHDVTDREVAILSRLDLSRDKVDVAVTAFRAGQEDERNRRGV